MYVKEKGRITNKEYQGLTGVSRATATRDLVELVEKGLLKIVGTGKRDIHYILYEAKMRQK